MIRARKKSISLLVTLVFLMSIMLPAGIAFGGTTYGDYSGAYKYVTADVNQAAGYAQVKIKDLGGATRIYAKVTLPAGVKYHAKPTAIDTDYVEEVNGGTGTITMSVADSADNMLQVLLENVELNDAVKFKFSTTDESALDISSDVSGDIKATIEIMGVDAAGTSILWVESEAVTIAKVAAKAVTVTAGDPKVVENGVGKDGADITIQESMPGSLDANEVICAQIETPDVTFVSDPSVSESQLVLDSTFDATGGDKVVLSTDKKLMKVKVQTASQVLPGKITIGLAGKLNVPPSVTGDIKITVYSEKTGSKLTKTTVTVAKVGVAAATVKNVKDNTDVCYIGQTKDLSAKFDLEATSGSQLQSGKTVILELASGKWNKDASGFWQVGTTYFGGKLTFQGLYNDDKTAWFTVASPTDKVTLDGFKVKAPGNTPAGDIIVKVSGTAGASGEAVIGKFAAPVSLSADKPEVKLGSTGQAAGDVLIKEADAGALKAGKYIALQLPPGVTFSEVPTAKVTEGNLKIGDVLVHNSNILLIEIDTPSGIASTIKVSGIKYDVSKTAAEGDLALTMIGGTIDGYATINEVDAKSLGKVVNATVVSATKRTAVFTIGSNVYTVNGVQYTMDVAAQEKNGRTMLPVRYVAYALGVDPANVLWDEATQTVTLLKGATVVQMSIGSKVLKLNGISITMDVAPELVSARTMLPYRFVAEAFGAKVYWDEVNKTVTMNIE